MKRFNEFTEEEQNQIAEQLGLGIEILREINPVLTETWEAKSYLYEMIVSGSMPRYFLDRFIDYDGMKEELINRGELAEVELDGEKGYIWLI